MSLSAHVVASSRVAPAARVGVFGVGSATVATMTRCAPALIVLVVAACRGAGGAPVATPLRPACGPGQAWTGTACQPVGPAARELAAGVAAITAFDVDRALVALDAAAAAGPLDHAQHVQLWEQRGLGLAYLEREADATAAFARLLALDPGHLLSYTLSPKATFVFERARKAPSRAPVLELGWTGGQEVGAAVPIDVEVVADPDTLLAHATLFVRTRGATTWQLAPLPLGPGRRRLVLPAVQASRPSALELHARGYDQAGNEVLLWASPDQPREIPLRFDPPPPWYRRWWVWAATGTVVALGTGIGVWAATREPPDKLDVPVGVR